MAGEFEFPDEMAAVALRRGRGVELPVGEVDSLSASLNTGASPSPCRGRGTAIAQSGLAQHTWLYQVPIAGTLTLAHRVPAAGDGA